MGKLLKVMGYLDKPKGEFKEARLAALIDEEEWNSMTREEQIIFLKEQGQVELLSYTISSSSDITHIVWKEKENY